MNPAFFTVTSIRPFAWGLGRTSGDFPALMPLTSTTAPAGIVMTESIGVTFETASGFELEFCSGLRFARRSGGDVAEAGVLGVDAIEADAMFGVEAFVSFGTAARTWASLSGAVF